jgi:peptidyl-tRNA hydrolase, PTH1 family
MVFGRRREQSRRGTPADLLVVGLGNPGKDYAGTRHNVGFEVVELLARRHGGSLKGGRENSLVAEVRIDGQRVTLAQPLTYMNLSGDAVGPLVRRHGIEDPERLVVVHDELDLPLGRVRVKVGGGLAGHNGLKSLRRELGDPGFARVRIGVGRPDSTDPELVAAHVLGRWRQPAGEVRDLVDRAADAAERIVLGEAPAHRAST